MKKITITSLFCILLSFISCKVILNIYPETLTPPEITTRIEANSKAIKTVAVLSFTPSPKYGKDETWKNASVFVNLLDNDKISCDLTEKEILKYINVVDRQTIDKILQEQNLQHATSFDNSTAVQLGKLLGCDVVLTGNINYAYANLRYIEKSSGWVSQYLGYYSIDMRLLDVTTGKILWVCSISRNTQNYLAKPIACNNKEVLKNQDLYNSDLHGANPEQRIKYVMQQSIREAIKDLSKNL